MQLAKQCVYALFDSRTLGTTLVCKCVARVALRPAIDRCTSRLCSQLRFVRYDWLADSLKGVAHPMSPVHHRNKCPPPRPDRGLAAIVGMFVS
jgi:hypothetical protein